MKFKDKTQRSLFMESLGTFQAGLGGTFGAYREAREAFDTVIVVHLYKEVEFKESDFADFERGFAEFQSLRIAMQLSKARAQQVMTNILANVGGLTDVKVMDYTDIADMIKRQDESKAKQSTSGQR